MPLRACVRMPGEGHATIAGPCFTSLIPDQNPGHRPTLMKNLFKWEGGQAASRARANALPGTFVEALYKLCDGRYSRDGRDESRRARRFFKSG